MVTAALGIWLAINVGGVAWAWRVARPEARFEVNQQVGPPADPPLR